MPVKKPVPDVASDREREFWERMADGEVPVQHCGECGRNAYPPRRRCPECYSEEWTYEPISGEGEVYGYTAIHRPSRPEYEDELPVVSAIIDLAEGPRLMAKVDCEPGDIEVGTPVELDPGNLSAEDVRLVFRVAE